MTHLRFTVLLHLYHVVVQHDAHCKKSYYEKTSPTKADIVLVRSLFSHAVCQNDFPVLDYLGIAIDVVV